MTGILFLAALGLVPFLGACICRFLSLPNDGPLSRIPVLAAVGSLALCWIMVLLTWLGVPWTVQGILLPFLILGALSLWRQPRLASVREALNERGAVPAGVLAILGLVATTYVAGSGRATSSDLLLFWGTKAEHFARSVGIDATYLTMPARGIHPDYPPLLPLLLAWGSLLAGRLAWGVTLLTLPLFVALAGLAFWTYARRALPARSAAEYVAVLVTLLGYTLCVSLCAGNGEPPLLFFEVLALAPLTFGDRSRSLLLVSSLALAGAVLTKVEGAAFAGLVIASYGVWAFLRTRSLRTLWSIAWLPLSSLLAWIIFARQHGLKEVYGSAHGTITFHYFGTIFTAIFQNASYNSAFAPWIIVTLLLLVGARQREWAPPVLVGAGFLGFMVYCYLHAGDLDPTIWIGWSAGRLLLTPLICLFFAATAPTRPLLLVPPPTCALAEQ